MTGGALQSQERLYHRRLRRRSLDDCTVNPNSTAMYADSGASTAGYMDVTGEGIDSEEDV